MIVFPNLRAAARECVGRQQRIERLLRHLHIADHIGNAVALFVANACDVADRLGPRGLAVLLVFNDEFGTRAALDELPGA